MASFIKALHDGNIDLAAKYFVADKQAQWVRDLAIRKERGVLTDVMGIFIRADDGKYPDPDHYLYTVVNQKGQNEFSIRLVRNSATNKWKIQDIQKQGYEED